MSVRWLGIGIVVMALTGTGCSTFVTKKRLELSSTPQGVEVTSAQGEAIGVTPLVLEGDALDKFSDHGRLTVVLSHPNYMQRQMTFDLHGEDSHSVELTKYNDDYFSQRLIKDYSAQTNAMLRELLTLQGMLLLRRLDEAEKGLDQFTKKYPTVAAAYVMLANSAQMRGKPQAAEAYLLRARSLDPKDDVIERTLKNLGSQVKKQ